MEGPPTSPLPPPSSLHTAIVTSSLDNDKSRLCVATRTRYPSSNNGEGGRDVDSSTELWEEEDEWPCPHCSSSTLRSQYLLSLQHKIQGQQASLARLQKTVQELECEKVHGIELRKKLEQQELEIREKNSEIVRLEKLLEEFDNLAQESDDLKLLLRLKDEEIHQLNRDLTKLSQRVSDYNEIEAHNTDLQSELFARDREVLALNHSEARIKRTYLELVEKSSTLEDKLLSQDALHQEERGKFEKSVVKLTNKLIAQRRRMGELEQHNARSVRDCRLAVRLLQCSSPASNLHSNELHHSNKLTFLWGEANNKPISNNDTNKNDLKMLRQNSLEEDIAAESRTPASVTSSASVTSPASVTSSSSVTSRASVTSSASVTSPGPVARTSPSECGSTVKRNHSTSCLESLHCISRQSANSQITMTSKPRLTPADVECANQESLAILKDLLKGKKDAIHVLRVELGKRDKEIGLLRKKLTHNISESINSQNMEPQDRIENLESRVSFLNDENFNLKYQLEICRKMLDKLSGVTPH